VSVPDRILRYLREELKVATEGIAPETPLFSTGRVDSFAMVDLIAFLEQEYRFRFDPLDITLDHLDSVARIAAYVASHRG
jgi:acyl carrier protein